MWVTSLASSGCTPALRWPPGQLGMGSPRGGRVGGSQQQPHHNTGPIRNSLDSGPRCPPITSEDERRSSIAKNIGMAAIPSASWKATDIRTIAHEAQDTRFDAIFTTQ